MGLAYRVVNGITVYRAEDSEEGRPAEVHERTAMGKHRDGSHYLRAASAEDGRQIMKAAQEAGVEVTKRRAGASHFGRIGAYDHFHVQGLQDAATIMEGMGREITKAHDYDQVRNGKIVHVHGHQGGMAGRHLEQAGLNKGQALASENAGDKNAAHAHRESAKAHAASASGDHEGAKAAHEQAAKVHEGVATGKRMHGNLDGARHHEDIAEYHTKAAAWHEKSKASATKPTWESKKEDVEGMDEADYKAHHDELEDDNQHDAARVLRAKRHGSDEHVAEAEANHKKFDKAGSSKTEEDMAKANDLDKRVKEHGAGGGREIHKASVDHQILRIDRQMAQVGGDKVAMDALEMRKQALLSNEVEQ